MIRLALAACLCSPLLYAGTARAELVPGTAGAQDSLLAVAPDGSPRVAFVAADGAIDLAVRASDGTWTTQAIPVPALEAPAIVGLVQAPSGTDALVESSSGSRLVLAEQRGAAWSVRTVAVAPKNGQLGFGALTLDSGGRPLVAYASLLKTRTSSLHLVHENAKGRLVGEAVTKDGFPPSEQPPTVAPVVLANGTVRVVEAYSGATIEWARTKNHKGWTGQYLYANSLAEPAGVLCAVPNPGGGAWSTWTELFPSANESQLILGLNLGGQKVSVLSHHAFVVALANAPSGPEVAADDYVDLEGARTVYAGLVVDAAGNTVELDGNLEGYALAPDGARQYLLLDPSGLSWYRSPTAPTASVTLSAAVDGASFVLTGKVVHAAPGSSVEIDRETSAGAQPLTTVPLAADGTFTLTDLPPVRPLTYRAIYRDPSGLPLAALVRDVLGA